MHRLTHARPGLFPLRFLPFRRTGGVRRSLFGLLLLWQDRSIQRYRLGEMDDAMLKDIGISRSEADRESRKPFWRG